MSDNRNDYGYRERAKGHDTNKGQCMNESMSKFLCEHYNKLIRVNFKFKGNR